MDATGRVESGTETEGNAYCHGWQVVEQCRSNCRGAVTEEQLSRSSYRGEIVEDAVIEPLSGEAQI